MNKNLTTVLGILVLATSCGGRAESGTSGGNSNWLMVCDRDLECGQEGACVAGRCLLECEAPTDCADLARSARCEVIAAATSNSSCETRSALSACVPTCDEPADCEPYGLACIDGSCVPDCSPETPVVDAGAPPEPTSDPTIPEPLPEAGAPQPSADAGAVTCTVAVWKTDCCEAIVAASDAQLASDPCLVPVSEWGFEEGATRLLECEVEASCDRICPILEQDPEFYAVAVPTEAGVCELSPACLDASCPGGPCDPTTGCDSGLYCSAPDCASAGVCLPVPNLTCDLNYDPVCGCDGLTYDTSCHAGGRPLAHLGECAPECFGPEENLDRAYDGTLTGCACEPSTDVDVCLPDSAGRLVALMCVDDRWLAVEDGPCEVR